MKKYFIYENTTHRGVVILASNLPLRIAEEVTRLYNNLGKDNITFAKQTKRIYKEVRA